MLTPDVVQSIQERVKYTPSFPAVIDSTMLSTFRSCQTKWFWEFCLNLGGESVDLVFGGAIARGCEVYRSQRCKGTPHEDALVEAVYQTIIQYGDFEPRDDRTAKTWLRACHVIVWYFEKQWPLDTDPYQVYRDMVEFTFAIPQPPELAHPETGDPILFAGRTDAILEGPGGIWVVDEKTAKGIGSKWAEQWLMRGQFHGYCYAAREHGIPSQGTLVRGIGILVGENKGGEAIVQSESWKIDSWVQDMRHTIKQMLLAYKHMTYAQDWSDACTAYGNCSFLELCTTKDPVPWVAQWGRRFWNPLDIKPATSSEELQ